MSNLIRLTNKYIFNLRCSYQHNRNIILPSCHSLVKDNGCSLNNNKNFTILNNNNNNNLFTIRYQFSTTNKYSSNNNRTYNQQQQNNSKINNPLELNNTSENINVNFVQPNQIKPFKPRLPPYETDATLDFLIIPNQKKFTEEEIEKFSKLAKALSSIGYQHQSEEKWNEALESYNKAMIYIRNLFGSGLDHQHHFNLRDYAALMVNMGEAHARLEQMDAAVLRSKQAVDILEIDWREQINFASRTDQDQLRTLWLKDEMLGIAYYNHAEYLSFHSRYEEAEPFIRAASRILSKLYPLDHPVNVDCGVMMVEILNETGRNIELDKVTETYGDILTDAVGVTEQVKSAYEKLDEGMMDKILESVQEKFPGFLESEEAAAEEKMKLLGQDIDADNDDTAIEQLQQNDQQPLFKEKEFSIEDILLSTDSSGPHIKKSFEDGDADDESAEQSSMLNTVNKISDIARVEKEKYGEDDFEQLLDDELDIDEEDMEDENEEDIKEIEKLSGFKLQMDETEKHLQKQYMKTLDQTVNLLPEDIQSVNGDQTTLVMNKIINNVDRILTEGSDKVSIIEQERIIDRDRRIRDRPSDVVDQVQWEDGKIKTPTDEAGEPISQASVHTMGRYLAEELTEHEMDEDEEVIEESIEKLFKMVNSMSSEDKKQFDKSFKEITPLMKEFMTGGNKASSMFNRSLSDLAQEELKLKEMIEREKEDNEYNDDDEDFNDEDEDEQELILNENPDLMRELMSKAEQYRFNPQELAKHINTDQYLTTTNNSMKKNKMNNYQDDEYEEDMDITQLLGELEGMEFEDEDLNSTLKENGDEDINLDSFIRQATKSQDFKDFLKSELKKNK